MNTTEVYDVCNRLFHEGWEIWEVERLYDFLTRYRKTSMDLPDLKFDIRHLEFLRYLVQTGRLSD